LSGRRYSRSKKIPRKTFYFKRILFSFPRKSADPRPIPIPDDDDDEEEEEEEEEEKEEKKKKKKKKVFSLPE
jgi:hypothetical protein